MIQTTPANGLLDELLEPWRSLLGEDFEGYRNHCHRVISYALTLRDASPEEQQKFAIAACFHDLGLWTEKTLDYLQPSSAAARSCLEQRSQAAWSDEICAMIDEHHRLRALRRPLFPLAEVFRQADLVDFSLGLVKCGISPARVREVQQAYPNAGFHHMLMKRAGAWIVRHPFNPAPMMKW